MPIQAVVYISQAGPRLVEGSGNFKSDKLSDVVADAARFNREAGVTGVLLFDGARFLQYLEGPVDGLRVAYSRVVGATSHLEMVELQKGRVGSRRLPFWAMRWLRVLPEELTELAHADWTRFSQRAPLSRMTPTAMDKLYALDEVHAQVA